MVNESGNWLLMKIELLLVVSMYDSLCQQPTKGGKRMKKLFLLSTIAFVFTITMGFFLNNAQAEEVEYQVVNYLVGVNYIPVPDVDKHAIGTYERRGVAIFKNGETAAFHTRGLWDFVNHNGVFNGYQTLTFPDGSTNMIKYSGNMTTEGENLPTLKAKG